MNYSIKFKGKHLELDLSGEKHSLKEIKQLVSTLKSFESALFVAPSVELRENVVKQLKNEILDDSSSFDVSEFWDIPSDLIQSNDAGSFISMESDLNLSSFYEKTSFSLQLMVSDQGQEYVLDRTSLVSAINKLQLKEKLSKTSSVLIRVKGSLSSETKGELEDFFRKFLSVEKLKVIFEKKNYSDRASLELILFGDFLTD